MAAQIRPESIRSNMTKHSGIVNVDSGRSQNRSPSSGVSGQDVPKNAIWIAVTIATGSVFKLRDLSADDSDMTASRVEGVLIRQHGFKSLDKQRVMREMLRAFDRNISEDLPAGTAEKAKQLFAAINLSFS
jgi:hypothetical protein